MPFRFLIAIGLVVFSLGFVSEASAEWWVSGFFKGIYRDIKERQQWPEKYMPADKAAVNAPFPTMMENGWRRQNMLVASHFDANTQQLTEAGQMKVRWILTSAPPQRRSVYIHVGDTDTNTSTRIASVQQYVAKISPKNLPPIMTTTISEDGWSAEEINKIGQKYLESMPDPKLQAVAGAGSGGGH
jgi:hypothetical protein